MAQTVTDVRHKAAAILSGHKLRQLEAAGFTVVSAEEIERLREELRHARRLLGALIVQHGGEIETTAQGSTTGA